MDEHGNFNIGPQVAEMLGIIKASKQIIVEVNENMPFANGETAILNITDVDFIVEGSKLNSS